MDCSGLTSVTVGMETPPAIDWYTFTNRTNATLYVPAGCKAAYKAAPYWQEFGSIVELITPDSKGDVNGDGAVDVADIATVIDVMAKGTNDKVADVNSDGAIDVADIATIIDIMAANARRQMELEEQE